MSLKLLIIEGCDRLGKSSLIKRLTNQADNYIVRHFGSVKGETDKEKRDFQFQFFKKEFTLANLRNQFDLKDEKRYPRDIYIFDRGHIGEFVYGKMYRNTEPENWVIGLENMFGLNIDISVYLLLLTGNPESLCKREDGLSLSSKFEDKKKELELFDKGFEMSGILNKKRLNVFNPDGEYIDQDIILDEVNKFLNFK